jgi:hypothetical protein
MLVCLLFLWRNLQWNNSATLTWLLRRLTAVTHRQETPHRQHPPQHSTFWPFPRKVAWGFKLLKTWIMFEGSKTGRPASDTIFSRQLTSATWKMSCLQHFLCVSSWYQFGEGAFSPNWYQDETRRILRKVQHGSLSSPWHLPPRLLRHQESLLLPTR